MKLFRTLQIAGAMLVAGYTVNAVAHHSFAAEFDADKPITIQGIVTKVEWANPHVWVFLNVEDEETGEVVNYGAELGPPHQLQRRGWRRNTLTIGTMIEVDAYEARNGTPNVNARSITLTSTGGSPGETLGAASSQLDQ